MCALRRRSECAVPFELRVWLLEELSRVRTLLLRGCMSCLLHVPVVLKFLRKSCALDLFLLWLLRVGVRDLAKGTCGGRMGAVL